MVFLNDEKSSSSQPSDSDNEIAIPEHPDSSASTSTIIDSESSEEIANNSEGEFDMGIAEEYFNRQNGTTVCRKCGEPGHRTVDCPNVATVTPCILCAETDHLAKDCPTNICHQYHHIFHITVVATVKDTPQRTVPNVAFRFPVLTVPLVYTTQKFPRDGSFTSRTVR